jgi:Fe-Mn family superoxide dismutase
MREFIDLVESKKTLELIKLPYSRGALSPVLSKANIDLHYGKLAKGYVDRFNSGEGDKAFNEAGAELHNIFFAQFRTQKNGNSPRGKILDLINRHHTSWVDFKKNFKEEALKVQGSGWIYLSKNGVIRTIKNHAKRTDIVLLVDMWEHSYQNDYHSDKGKYIDNLWRIMNWDAVNRRI